ncbi:hypothetical protein AAHB52_13240 [Bacillus toyonensis]
MNKKIIEELMEEVIEETKEEIKEQIKERVKEKMLEEISKEISKDTVEDIIEEQININPYKQFFVGVLAILFYIFISVSYLLIMKYSFNILRDTEVIGDFVKIIVYFVIVLILICIYLEIAHTLYRLKQNKSTSFMYALFEISLGLVTLVATGWSFLDEPSNGGIKSVTFLAVYGSMYVVVRGMETVRKHSVEGKVSKVLWMDLSKETKFSKFFDEKLR